MKYFSVFSGVGGFEIGIEMAYEQNRRMGDNEQADVRVERSRPEEGDDSGEHRPLSERPDGHADSLPRPMCVGFSEIDKYASAVLRYHYPNIPNYGDIQKIQWDTVPDFDLLTGGVPCQSWSVAGKRGGFDDARGNMWFEFSRCLRAKQPKIFIAENVKGLLSHDGGKSFERIAEELCDCGYAIDFEVLNAKNFGVPQSRERVFIVGKRLDTLSKDSIV